MCGLFGLLDYQRQLSSAEKQSMLNALAIESEVRGKDATGIAYYNKNRLRIQKAPFPAHLMQFQLPHKASFIMGHTRAATHGLAKDNYNNHPFVGHANGTFALAHNGVLYNHLYLRKMMNLPETGIQTDSYLAVQLLEQSGYVDFDTLKDMAETVQGSFTFTVLNKSGLYIVRGSSPFCLYDCADKGYMVYASTKDILEKALLRAGCKDAFEEIPVTAGDILHIDHQGAIEKGAFHYDFYLDYGYPALARGAGDKQTALAYAFALGMEPEEVELLLMLGYNEYDLDDMLYDAEFCRDCKAEIAEYMYVGGN